jgi:hypothetical protein
MSVESWMRARCFWSISPRVDLAKTAPLSADLADAVRIEDLRQAAVFMAVTTWQAAMRDEPIPRQKR